MFGRIGGSQEGAPSFDVFSGYRATTIETANATPVVGFNSPISPEKAEILFGREWVVAPEAPIPQGILQISGIAPEQALMALAGRQDYTVERFTSTPRMEPEKVALPPLVTADVNEISEPAVAFREILKGLPLFSDDYVVGTAVECGVVSAVELKTRPIRLTTPDMDLSAMDLSVDYDPVLWQIGNPGYAGLNKLAKVAAVLQIRAELISNITTRASQRIIEARMAQLGISAEKINQFLGDEVLANDERRLKLMEVALKAQLLAGRTALKQMILEGRPSREVFFLAFCLNQFHTGELGQILTHEGRTEAWNNSGWGQCGSADLEKELARVQGVLAEGVKGSQLVYTSGVSNEWF